LLACDYATFPSGKTFRSAVVSVMSQKETEGHRTLLAWAHQSEYATFPSGKIFRSAVASVKSQKETEGHRTLLAWAHQSDSTFPSGKIFRSAVASVKSQKETEGHRTLLAWAHQSDYATYLPIRKDALVCSCVSQEPERNRTAQNVAFFISSCHFQGYIGVDDSTYYVTQHL
jgi:hypothetical protein